MGKSGGRHRRGGPGGGVPRHLNFDGHPSTKTSQSKTNQTFIFSWAKRIIATSVLAIALGLGYRGYIETRVNTPLAVDKAVILTGLQVPDRFWGTYR